MSYSLWWYTLARSDHSHACLRRARQRNNILGGVPWPPRRCECSTPSNYTWKGCERFSNETCQVGGILPGSMPPNSKFLWEEGAVFDSFMLVRDGVFAEDELRRLLCDEPTKMPASSGTRCFQDNVTDLKAQVAANHTGIRLVRQLIEEYTMDVVQVCLYPQQPRRSLSLSPLRSPKLLTVRSS